jgi:chromosome segregation ATPase
VSTLKEMGAELDQLESQLESMIIQSDPELELPAEVVHFAKTRLGWDDQRIKTERRRILAVVALRQVAMTCEERTRLAERLEASTLKLQAEGPALEAKIAELTSKLSALRAEPAKCQGILSVANDALEKLEKQIPPKCVREIARIKTDSKELIAHRNELQTTVEHLRLVLSRRDDIDTVQLYQGSPTRLWVDNLDHASEATPLIQTDSSGSMHRYQLSPSAAAHFAKAEKLLPEWEKELEEMNEAVRTTVDEPIRKLRCFYHSH